MIKFDKLIAKGNNIIMYRNSEILEIIMKKYKLKLGMKLNILLLNNIKQIEGMEIKDLIYILEINPNTYYKLKNGKQIYTKLKFNNYSQIKILKDEERIDKIQFKTIQNKLGIKNYTLMKLLGITRYKYNKMMKNDKYEINSIDVKAKHIVNLMKIDFKYIKKYGNRYYKIEELTEYCKERKITINQFAKYYSNNVKHYKFNKIVIEKSQKGFWIGGKLKLSEKFTNKNYIILYNRCVKLSNKMAHLLHCQNLKDEFCDIAICKIVEDGGVIVKTFYFDIKLMLNILMKKAKYAIFNYYRKENNRIIYYDEYENNYLEHTKLLTDSRYDPQLLVT